MRATLIEWALKVVMYLCCLPMLLAIALADRIPKKKKKGAAPLRSAEASPQEAERPALPGPVIEHLSQAEREKGRMDYGKDFEERRYKWAAKMEAEELIREVGGF